MALKIEVKIDGFDCDIRTPEGWNRLLSAWLGDACPAMLREVHAIVFRYILRMAEEGYTAHYEEKGKGE